MVRKTTTVLMSALLALSLCACGSNGADQPSSESGPVEEATESSVETNESETEEFDPMVDNIDMSVEGGSIRFVRVEKANEGLVVDEGADNALIFVFEFTNEQNEPAQAQSVFWIQFFQNGTELNSNYTYSSSGGDQYELVGAFFNNAMKGGTVTFGKIVVPRDDSPITIMMSQNGVALDNNYQMMEVPINSSGATSNTQAANNTPTSYSAEEIDAALQGSWTLDNSALFTYNQGTISIESPGVVLSGTYEIDVDGSVVIGRFEATDGTVKIEIPYDYDGETLTIYNSDGQALSKV